MNKSLLFGILMTVVVLAALAASPVYGGNHDGEQSAGGPPVVPGAYYVIFNDTVASPADAADDLAKTHGLQIRHVFSLTGSAFSADIPPGRAEGLSHDPRVASVSPIPQAKLAEEVTPTGIDRINAELVAADGSGVDVAVLDTGSGPHPDLVVHSQFNPVFPIWLKQVMR